MLRLFISFSFAFSYKQPSLIHEGMATQAQAQLDFLHLAGLI
jgi:hypothetical protein